MSESLGIALVQVAATEGDLDRTLSETAVLVSEAARSGADLVLLPEFFSREYFPQYRDLQYVRYAESEGDGPTFQAVREWASTLGVSIVAGVYEKAAPGLYYDTAFFVDRRGDIVGKYRKTHPAAVRSLEKLYFRGGAKYPVFVLEDWKVGSVICYDLWFPEAMRCSALGGAELVVVPYASWEEPLWHEVIQTRAFENGLYVAVCNKVGREGDWRLQGKSLVSDPEGNILVECSSTDSDVRTVTVEKSLVSEARVTYPMYRDRRPELYGRLAIVDE